jgi:hypothetical protein
MSCHAAIRRRSSPPIMAEDVREISHAQERPGSILAIAETEIETQMLIDRLLRECFKAKS